MYYLIDIGSSTIKVYERSKGMISLLLSRTFDFKFEFEPSSGISKTNKDALFALFDELSLRYSLNKSNTKIFATGIFRDIQYRQNFIEEFYTHTGLYFNIISHELETFFLEKALIGAYTNDADVLVINIGGKTTELLFYSNSILVDKKMLDYGVGTILKKYPAINDNYSHIELSKIISEVYSVLPIVKTTPKIAFYTGGELTYMQIAGYFLQKNTIFADSNHPYQISYEDFCVRNTQIFRQVSIDSLRNLMPENPAWMNGARPCSAIAQAICSFYSIETIIPSDVNLINGVITQEARTATICGSFNRNLQNVTKLIGILQEHGISVLSPQSTEIAGIKNGFLLFDGDNMINNCTWSVESIHLQAIENSDIIIVCNCRDYIGTKTSMEIGYAYKCGKKIVFIEDNITVKDFDLPSEVGLICCPEF